MTITGVCYSTRYAVKNALDIKESARVNDQIDRALAGAVDSIESLCNRKFYPQIDTRFWDWPTLDRFYPWRLWLDANELISVTTLTSGGVVIPSNQYFLRSGKGDAGPPYSHIELDRSTVAAFSAGSTPQRAISILGAYGFRADTTPGGALAAAMVDTTGTILTVTDSSKVRGGSSLLIDTERMLVTGETMVTTGQTQQGSGAGTAMQSDVGLSVTDGTKYAVGEILLLDSERMLVTDIAGNVLTVKRAWDGTVLTTHSGSVIFAPRQLTVTRGALGTTAATHLNNAAISVHLVPGIVNELAVAEAVNFFLQETSGYARTVGSGDNVRNVSGAGLADLRSRCVGSVGRKSRRRTI